MRRIKGLLYTSFLVVDCSYFVWSFATPNLTPLCQPELVHKNNIALYATPPNQSSGKDANSRRTFVNQLGSIASLSFVGVGFQSKIVNAISEEKPKEFVDLGTQAPAPDGQSEFVELQNGVKVKDFKSGTGSETIQSNSSVQIQCSGKLLNLNGVSFYNTKNNNPDGFGAVPLSIRLGTGQAIPGLESGIVGMRKGGIRRIIIPADLAYSKFPDLEPKPLNANDQRTLDSVVKNSRRDATILFDVSVERFK